jgi:hypothetical protein
MIRIDVHHAVEIRLTRHTYPTLSPRMVSDHTYLIWLTHSNLSCSHQQSWVCLLLLRNRALDTIHSTSVDRSAGSYLISLPRQPLKQWGQSQSSVDNRLLGLSGPYHRYAIGTFNTCSRGSTHWSLTDTDGGYNHLRAPPGLRFPIST